MNLLKLALTFLSSSVILNAGTVSWSSGVNAPIDNSTLIVLFSAILFIGLWFSRKAPTSVKLSLVALVLVSGAYEYNLNAAPKTITMSSTSGSDTFVDADGFVLVNSSGGSVSVTITPGGGYSCPAGGCNLSVASSASSTIAMVSSQSTQSATATTNTNAGFMCSGRINTGTITTGFSITINGGTPSVTGGPYTFDGTTSDSGASNFSTWLTSNGISAASVIVDEQESFYIETTTAGDTVTFQANGTELVDILGCATASVGTLTWP